MHALWRPSKAKRICGVTIRDYGPSGKRVVQLMINIFPFPVAHHSAAANQPPPKVTYEGARVDKPYVLRREASSMSKLSLPIRRCDRFRSLNQPCLEERTMQTGLVQNAHDDLVTDAAYDFYGLHLATCSLDQRSLSRPPMFPL